LKKEGKLDMTAAGGDVSPAAAATATVAASVVAATVLAAPGTLSDTAAAAAAGAGAGASSAGGDALHKGPKGGVVEGFMAMFSFRDESIGDQIKFGLCVLLAMYLVVNYLRWQSVSGKLATLEEKLHRMENLAQQLLAKLPPSVGNAAAGAVGAAAKANGAR
jgi:hypothetical protein